MKQNHTDITNKWEFVFLGANQDAIKVATNFGMAAGNAMNYAANAVGTWPAYAVTSAIDPSKEKTLERAQETLRLNV